MGLNAAAAFAILGGTAALLLPLALIVLFSRISGWNTLAERYPANRPAPYPRKHLGYGIFRGWIGYNGGIVVAADMQGLYLAGMPVILSFCHKPIFIPWPEIQEIRRRAGWRGGYEIHTRGAPGVDFVLRRGTFDFIKERARAAQVLGDYDG